MRGLLQRIADHRRPGSWAARLRGRRHARFLELLRELPGPLRILDVGGTPSFWRAQGGTPAGARVTILNRSSLAPDQDYECVVGDACDMRGIAAGAFDVVFSNSVIEHVGDFRGQAAMAAEVRRVGRRYYVQTPYRHFPIEPHFVFPCFQYLPLGLRAWLAHRFALGWHPRYRSLEAARQAAASVRLLDLPTLARLFPDARIERERVLGLTKSLVAVGWR
jgi:SAM-dependent methyltransferase